ncbi:hypothetical protein ACQV2W_07865 [Facklamia sp. P12934]|uniref:hypothetical protein n=1 Tax=Facklamia sp. P12934 TaxID=3421948 RepID=UPI003D16A8E5
MLETMKKLIKPLPNYALKSFTSDRGKEFACYKEMRKLESTSTLPILIQTGERIMMKIQSDY